MYKRECVSSDVNLITLIKIKDYFAWGKES